MLFEQYAYRWGRLVYVFQRLVHMKFWKWGSRLSRQLTLRWGCSGAGVVQTLGLA